MEQPSSKRRKRNPADEMICPIRLELPIDPVTAEDGRLYEKEAILEFFAGKEGQGQVKSPYTNELMGRKLFQAKQHRNTIEILIENSVIVGDLAEKWKQKANEKKEMEDLVKKAEAGDGDAAGKICLYCYTGSKGFKKDMKLALKWSKKAHECGDLRATATMAEILLKGLGGVPKNQRLGTVYLSMAAAKSDLAAFLLGRAFAEGRYGLPVDKGEACRLLTLVVNGTCAHQHLTEIALGDATKILLELLDK